MLPSIHVSDDTPSHTATTMTSTTMNDEEKANVIDTDGPGVVERGLRQSALSVPQPTVSRWSRTSYSASIYEDDNDPMWVSDDESTIAPIQRVWTRMTRRGSPRSRSPGRRSSESSITYNLRVAHEAILRPHRNFQRRLFFFSWASAAIIVVTATLAMCLTKKEPWIAATSNSTAVHNATSATHTTRPTLFDLSATATTSSDLASPSTLSTEAAAADHSSTTSSTISTTASSTTEIIPTPSSSSVAVVTMGVTEIATKSVPVLTMTDSVPANSTF